VTSHLFPSLCIHSVPTGTKIGMRAGDLDHLSSVLNDADHLHHRLKPSHRRIKGLSMRRYGH